ncbi:MAG: hypothetical protein K9J30_06435 [Bacteroidales bacterium]|nr:hypothetical protein [Bacteroidales bacterium]
MQKRDICFILYRPAVPGNIGASARAIKTMGFDDLRLIEPADHLSDEARMMAHGSVDILEKAKIFTSFEEAAADLDLVIATTAKTKAAKVDYIRSDHLLKFLEDKGSMVKKAGIVFGTEESGLPGRIILNSNAGLSIPMETKYPSLNLSQAVMIIAYELCKSQDKAVDSVTENQPDPSWNELQERTSIILEKSGILPSTPLYHRIIERMSFLKASDARLVHSVTSRLMKVLTF